MSSNARRQRFELTLPTSMIRGPGALIRRGPAVRASLRRDFGDPVAAQFCNDAENEPCRHLPQRRHQPAQSNTAANDLRLCLRLFAQHHEAIEPPRQTECCPLAKRTPRNQKHNVAPLPGS